MINRVKHVQWTVDVDEGTGKYNIYNPGDNNEKRFYEIVAGKYGQPIIVAEPELAFDPPANLLYVNVNGENMKPDQKIAGIVCKNGPRLSLSNAKINGVEISVTGDNSSLWVDGQKYYIKTLFVKDKNRVIGYDAFCVSADEQAYPTLVRVLELGDLDLF